MGRMLLPSDFARQRFCEGPIMFLIPFLFGWASLYVIVALPELIQRQKVVAIAGDLMLIAGFCLMGGQARDKCGRCSYAVPRLVFPHRQVPLNKSQQIFFETRWKRRRLGMKIAGRIRI